MRGLSTEVRQRLQEVRPATLGQAARVPGVTPAAISLLLVHLKRHSGIRSQLRRAESRSTSKRECVHILREVASSRRIP